jgi:hypothetical protein
MRKVISFLFVLCGIGFAALPPCTKPIASIDTALVPKVVYVDQNDNEAFDCINEQGDTLRAILSALGGTTGSVGLSSVGDIKANIDRDSNTTGSRFWVANHTNDTLFRVSDDLAIRAYGAFSVVGASTLAALSATTGAFSSTLGVTGAFTGTSGAFSTTLGVTGALTSAEAVFTSADNDQAFNGTFTSSAAYAAGTNSTWRTATVMNAATTSGAATGINGVVNGNAIGGIAFVRNGTASHSGSTVLLYGTGSTYAEGLRVAHTNGAVTIPGTLGVTGAATAASLVTTGNVTADSLISSKFYEEGTFTGTLTGMTTSPTTTARWIRMGKHVSICLDTARGTSNVNTFTVTGMPSGLYPARKVNAGFGAFQNSAAQDVGAIFVLANGTIEFQVVTASFTNAQWGAVWGTSLFKGIGASSNTVESVCFAYNRQ